MNRRRFLGSALALAGGATVASRVGMAAIPKMKVRRIRYYQPQHANPTFNQSNRIVTVETDSGITGIGEGGSKDMMDQCAPMLIGENPSRIDHLWQFMYRGWFYPPGREKLHALGALDMALWDIKGKALGVPVYELLGGLARQHIECYSTGVSRGGTLQERVRAVMEAGFRAYRTAVDMPWSAQGGGTPTGVFRAHLAVDQEVEKARQIREGLGKDGDWLTDVHTRLDPPMRYGFATCWSPLRRMRWRILCAPRIRGFTSNCGPKSKYRSRWASNSATAGTSMNRKST